MHIRINTDRSIEGHEALATHIRGVVEDALSQLGEHITRVEVHLSDENGAQRGENDLRCMIEARIEGYHPLAVTAHADDVHPAVVSAADKLARLIENTLGRLHDHKHRRDALTAPDEIPALDSRLPQDA